MIHPDAMVRLANAAEARNADERLLCRILEKDGPRRAAEVVQRVAQEMYAEELRRGAGAVDIGMVGPAIFNEDAQALLEGMLGRCITVAGEPGA